MSVRSMGSRDARRGFTVVEMLVVIGILTVVSLGVATIFQSIGQTVARGRQLSELNQFAARMERIMREDFDRMTRDGFLVIVNKHAGSGNDVSLYRGQNPLPQRNLPGLSVRRSDEIMFFARGDFVSQRRPLAPEMIAASGEASIYYGHGHKRRPLIAPGDFNTNPNLFFDPKVWDTNFDPVLDTRVGASTLGFVNPNEFARDWSLLRQVTLLANPEGPGQQIPQELFGFSRNDFVQRGFLLDSPRQIKLQPAARSIFKSLGATGNGSIPPALFDWSERVQALPLPQTHSYVTRTSGMVDIVTQDLASIRTEIQSLSAGSSPSFSRPGDFLNTAQAYGRAPRYAPSGVSLTRDQMEEGFYEDFTLPPRPNDAFLSSPNGLELGRLTVNGAWSTSSPDFDINDVQRVREWMIDALPSAWIPLSRPGPNEFLAGVRYEDTPTRLLYDEFEFDGEGNPALARAFAEANQEMLGSSVFVPRCTEFIVEWSYGFVDNSLGAGDLGFKQLIWYGLPRLIDTDNDGQLNQGSDVRAAVAYNPRGTGAAATDDSVSPAVRRPQGPAPELIVGRGPGGPGLGDPAAVEVACFGFSTRPGEQGEAEQQGRDPDVEGTTWPWPRLIRITMTLGDPAERDVEETYQIILEVPDPG